jgi:hypothetical protein
MIGNRIVFILLLFFIGISNSVSQELTRAIELEWNEPQRMLFGEDQFLDVLYFTGGTFSDTMPAIPLYTFRKKNDVPYFSYDFKITDSVFVPVSQNELVVLEASGFRQTDVHINIGEQWERKQHYSVVNFYPIRYNLSTGGYEKLVSFSLTSVNSYNKSISYQSAQTYTNSSVLAEGDWYKVCVEKTGIHRLGYNDLLELGVPMANLQKNQISLFGNGGGMLPESNMAERHDDLKENAIYISGNATGLFGQNDFILFYGQSPNNWYYDESTGFYDHEVHLYSTENCYFISTTEGSRKRIGTQQSNTDAVTHHVNTFLDFEYHQRDLTNLIGSGREWYGEVFETTQNRSFNFNFSDLDINSHARVKVSVAARSSVTSTFNMRAGAEESVVSVPFVNLLDDNGFFARQTISTLLFKPLQQNGVSITLNYNRPTTTSRGWLQYIAINVIRNLRFSGSQMAFRNTSVIGTGHNAEYTITNAPDQVFIWDITDRFNIRQQTTTRQGTQQQFRVDAGILREFIAFDGSAFLSPTLKGKIVNQNLHALDNHDMVIVSPEKFLDEARRLADFRSQHDGLSICIVSPQQIYNEFSSGTPDASAIRNFMKMFYDRAENESQLPRYLLLFGNGTIDNKNMLGHGGNLIPTYQSQASLSPSNSFMTDDYYGLLADNEGEGAAGLLDLGIGRLPVRTLDEAKTLVDKIIRYDKRFPGLEPDSKDLLKGVNVPNYADWRNLVVFVADDGDYNTHFSHAERLSDIVHQNHPYYNIDKIYLDAYQMITMAGGSRYPDVNRTINDRVNSGALLINYIGHGGVRGLAHERVVTFDDIATWNNFYNMPVFMTATCEFSSFDQPSPDELSAGVRILQKPDGGAVALYTTTRLAWSGTNLTLNENFMRNVFKPDSQGNYPRLGDLIRLAKVQSDGNVQPWRLKNFVLLGDPSMQMAYPKHRVVTETVTDTLRAFQKITVTGYISDYQGYKMSDYHGVLYPTVYDKFNLYQTRANASGSNKANFHMQNSKLYKGKASITNGEFSFSFVVPKDIAYHYGNGKISYYFDNGEIDGHGYFTGITIGGTSTGGASDNEGPKIRLFINDTTFISGGTTNENPVLLAYLSDQNGINISGRIGHDILAFLNDQTAQPIVLNSYYESDKDSYQSGRVVYPFSRLDDGHYTLTMRVWDILNNPSTEQIEFVVTSSGKLLLTDLMNQPNPVGEYGTSFSFTHNHPFSDLKVKIDVFDLGGRLVKTINTNVQSAGFKSPLIHWDGTTSDGYRIGNGVYIYRLQLTTPDGLQSYQAEKLVVVREGR